MIAHLSGKLKSKDPALVVVDVGGVGYGLTVPVSTLSVLPEIGQSVELFTHTYVREDTLALYGFASGSELRLFEQLLSVSGIGPKVALAILSLSNPDDIRSAIASGDTAFLGSVPGVGKKTAERVVVELRDKMEMIDSRGDIVGNQDVIEALVGLGYRAEEARRAVAVVATSESETDAMLKAALKELAK